ncbi:nitrogen fixation protein NifZ [Methylococcus sp. ANG]|uniref:nitrogen fixation protein NifZ n=1 Tax=Methylococcus sp. ANG TaxID=3231903 RepID=UPI003458476D
MIDQRAPIYQWGQKVSTEVDIFNDGSYPDHAPEALLVAAGTEGEIVQIGHHEEANIPVYLVEFPGGYVIGCFEEELSSERKSVQVAGLL